jgi:hypothetical protein
VNSSLKTGYAYPKFSQEREAGQMNSQDQTVMIMLLVTIAYLLAGFVFPIWASLRAYKRGYISVARGALWGTLLGMPFALSPLVGVVVYFMASERPVEVPEGGLPGRRISTGPYNQVRRVLKKCSKVLFESGGNLGDVILSTRDLLQITKNKENGPILILALNDKDSGVQQAAAHCLGQMKNPGAVEPLKRLLETNNEAVRTAARKALAQLGVQATTIGSVTL